MVAAKRDKQKFKRWTCETLAEAHEHELQVSLELLLHPLHLAGSGTKNCHLAQPLPAHSGGSKPKLLDLAGLRPCRRRHSTRSLLLGDKIEEGIALRHLAVTNTSNRASIADVATLSLHLVPQMALQKLSLGVGKRAQRLWSRLIRTSFSPGMRHAWSPEAARPNLPASSSDFAFSRPRAPDWTPRLPPETCWRAVFTGTNKAVCLSGRARP